jgi:hypothetical protein
MRKQELQLLNLEVQTEKCPFVGCDFIFFGLVDEGGLDILEWYLGC